MLVLQLPDFSKTFTIDVDACEYGVHVVIHQGGHPITYTSKPLGPKNRGLSTYIHGNSDGCRAVIHVLADRKLPHTHRSMKPGSPG